MPGPEGEAPRSLRRKRRIKLVLGWVERVSLPRLGLWDLDAKVDTGARTSALHVAAVRPLAKPDRNGRTLVEVLLPSVHGAPARTVRLRVTEYVEIRDTSGRCERRPVVETVILLGPLRRRVRLSLTNRGDMVYPMLVGRTALRGVLVDPTSRRRAG